MTFDVQSNVLVRCPIDVVATFLHDVRNVPRWCVDIEAVELQTPLPLAAGSRVVFVSRMAGRYLAQTYEISELEPAAKMVIRPTQGAFPMETAYRWDPAGEQCTRITVRNRGTPAGFARLLRPLLAHGIRRASGNDLVRLKWVLERDVAAAPGMSR